MVSQFRTIKGRTAHILPIEFAFNFTVCLPDFFDVVRVTCGRRLDHVGNRENDRMRSLSSFMSVAFREGLKKAI